MFMLRLRIRYPFLTVALFAALSVAAQDNMSHGIIAWNTADTSVAAINGFLSDSMDAEVTLLKKRLIRSQAGVHTHFDLLIHGIPLYNGLVKLNRFSAQKATLSFPEVKLGNVPSRPVVDSNAIRSWITAQGLIKKRYEASLQWFIGEQAPVPAWVIRYEVPGDYLESVISQEGEVLAGTSLAMNAKPDSTVAVKVFLPDPVTAARSEYGGILQDSGDANAEALNEWMVWDSITVKWDASLLTWMLQSDYAMAVDVSEPYIAPPRSATGDFVFGRGESGFEYVNAFYHIHRQQQYVQSLGFDNLCNYPIRIDAHAKNGADQSTFYPTPGNERLEFGDGGVDDAEDADVIIHEYGHALNYSAAPGTNGGGERQSIEEGTADFYAIAYSRAISDHQRDYVFNWDGHNEFWDGRQLDRRRTYPSDLSGELYSDGVMWTTALADANDLLGRDISHILLFNAFYSFFPFMTMPDAARLYMQADTLLYGAKHGEELSIIFCKRGFLPGCEDTLVSSLPLEDPYLGGTAEFANNMGPLRLFPNERVIRQVQLFDLGGRLLYNLEVSGGDQLFYELDLPALHNGIFILRVTTDAGAFSFKLLRQAGM